MKCGIPPDFSMFFDFSIEKHESCGIFSILFPHGNCMGVGFELFNNFVEKVTFSA